MIALRSVLVRLKDTLPCAEEVTEDNLYKLEWAIEDVLNIGSKVVWLDDGSSASLPENLLGCVNGWRACRYAERPGLCILHWREHTRAGLMTTRLSGC